MGGCLSRCACVRAYVCTYYLTRLHVLQSGWGAGAAGSVSVLFLFLFCFGSWCRAAFRVCRRPFRPDED